MGLWAKVGSDKTLPWDHSLKTALRPFCDPNRCSLHDVGLYQIQHKLWMCGRRMGLRPWRREEWVDNNKDNSVIKESVNDVVVV